MKVWTWQIPEIYLAYIVDLGVEGHPLYLDFLKTRASEIGVLPQAYEIYPNVFLWRNHGHRMIYERLTQERMLLLTSIERMP